MLLDSWFNSQFPRVPSLSGRLWGTSTDTWLKHMRIIGGLQPFIRIVSPFVPARSQSKVLGDIQKDQDRLYKYLDILMLHTKIWRFSMGFSWFPGLSFSGWTVAVLCNCNKHSKSPTWNDLWFWGMVVPDVNNSDQGECSHWCRSNSFYFWFNRQVYHIRAYHHKI